MASPDSVEQSVVIPGTVRLVDTDEGVHSGLSRRRKDTDIKPVPQPSPDPNDPLNWSQRRKLRSFAMIIVYIIGIGIPGTMHYSVMGDITADTGIPTHVLVEGNGYMFLLLGWACLFWQPIALTYGRRGVYLISVFLNIPLMIWTAYSGSAGQWYAHRILIGFIGSAIESLPEVSVPDVFFAHERGFYMAIYVFCLFGSNFLSPIIAGWFALSFGWRWTMKFGAIISAASFVVLFLFMEDTIYFRDSFEGMPTDDSATPKEVGHDIENSQAISNVASTTPPQKSYWQKLKPFVNMPGRPSNKQMFRAMYLPLVILVKFPSVAWAGFIYGINLSWYMVINGTVAPILASPPYSWSTGLIGTAYVGPIIGAALGTLWSGIVPDWMALRSARRNNGIREPEHRLWVLAVSAVLSAIGLITWGAGTDAGVAWIGPIFGLGILVFSVVTGASIALSYNVDCFKDISGDSTAGVIIVRNTMGFAISYGITPWYTNMGLTRCFILAGFMSLGCTGTFLFMIWKGKALRRFSAKTYWKYVETSRGFHGG